MLTNIGLPGLLLVLIGLPGLVSGIINGFVQFMLSPLHFLATYPIF
jgi:hypothetical protein